MLLRASLLRLARVRNCSSKSRIDSGSGRPLVELAADQQPLRMAVKFAFAAFMTYEIYDLFLKSDTLFINGYVRLASSKDAYNVATGVSRMSRLRDSDAALAEVVACRGVEPLVRALGHHDPPTRLAALDLLARLPPAQARDELIELRATARAAHACRELEEAPLLADAKRCRELNASLAAALAS